MINPDTQAVIDANPAAQAFYGYPRRNLGQMTTHDLADGLVEPDEQGRYFEAGHRCADDSVHTVEIYAGPIAVGPRLPAYWIVHDITERIRAEAALAATGVKALAKLQAEPFDLIFMDVQIPEMDGIEATQTIRHTFDSTQQPYIIAMTAYAMGGDREACLAAGMDDHISKPVRIETLVQEIQTFGARAGNTSGQDC